MSITSLVALCFLPVITVFAFVAFLQNDKRILRYVVPCFFGILTVIPASFIQFFVLKIPVFSSSTFISILITSIIFNGLIEETFKLIFIMLIPKKNLTLATFLISSILLGMSSGAVETLIYVLGSLQKISSIADTNSILKLILMRIFSAQLIHAFCAGLLGIFVWQRRNGMQNFMPLAYSVVLHGFYNFFMAFSSGFRWFAAASILMAAVECRIWYLTAKNSKNSSKIQNMQLTQSDENTKL